MCARTCGDLSECIRITQLYRHLRTYNYKHTSIYLAYPPRQLEYYVSIFRLTDQPFCLVASLNSVYQGFTLNVG